MTIHGRATAREIELHLDRREAETLEILMRVGLEDMCDGLEQLRPLSDNGKALRREYRRGEKMHAFLCALLAEW